MGTSGLRALSLCACLILSGCGIPDGIAYAVKSVNPTKNDQSAPIQAINQQPAPVEPSSYRDAIPQPATSEPPAVLPQGPRGPIRAEALQPP